MFYWGHLLMLRLDLPPIKGELALNYMISGFKILERCVIKRKEEEQIQGNITREEKIFDEKRIQKKRELTREENSRE